MKAILALSDGRIFEGESFGAEGETEGEVIFNTSMTGYQEVLTDPSYYGQMVCMTYPMIGNYGINQEDFESERAYLNGFIIKELSATYSNWRSTQSLDSFLKEYNIIGIQGIDTRALTRHIRKTGAQQAILSTKSDNIEFLRQSSKESSGLIGRDLVREVTCKKPYEWNKKEWLLNQEIKNQKNTIKNTKFLVIVYDLGVKHNILRNLAKLDCRIIVVPANTSAKETLKYEPDGVFLSNGPGDPEGVPYVIESTRQLIEKVPIFGICLGHQIISLALGAKTYKLRFGHHGGNQPVIDLSSRKVEITSQNHGFAVDSNSIGNEVQIISFNLNDKTVEGIQHKNRPILSVQYHPEASPGPRDSNYLFQKFIQIMSDYR